MLYCMKKRLRFVPCVLFSVRFVAFFRDMAYSTPIEAIVIISDVFPELISGNGKPVGGILPLTTSALITVCIAYTSVIPEASKKEKKSSDCEATFIPL